jgi:hypothetical protein
VKVQNLTIEANERIFFLFESEQYYKGKPRIEEFKLMSFSLKHQSSVELKQIIVSIECVQYAIMHTISTYFICANMLGMNRDK